MASKKKAAAPDGGEARGGKISLQVFPGTRRQVEIQEDKPYTLQDLLEDENQDSEAVTVKVNGEETSDLKRALGNGDSVLVLENVEGG